MRQVRQGNRPVCYLARIEDDQVTAVCFGMPDHRQQEDIPSSTLAPRGTNTGSPHWSASPGRHVLTRPVW